LLDKVNTIPFGQIGKNLDGILQSVNDVANGAQMRQALTELSAAVAQLKNMVEHVDSGMSPALRQLPDIATGLQKTLTTPTDSFCHSTTAMAIRRSSIVI
jgi:paraquat-inducible protein B